MCNCPAEGRLSASCSAVVSGPFHFRATVVAAVEEASRASSRLLLIGSLPNGRDNGPGTRLVRLVRLGSRGRSIFSNPAIWRSARTVGRFAAELA
jgi:hypothetical protein